MVGQQGGVCTQDRTGVVGVLVVHAGHDLIIGGDVQIRSGVVDIVGIDAVQDGLFHVLFGVVDVELDRLLRTLVVAQLLVVALHVGIAFVLCFAVLDHVLFIRLLGRSAGCGLALFCRLLDGGVPRDVLHNSHACKQYGADQGCGRHLPVFAQDCEQQGNEVDLLFLLIRDLVFSHKCPPKTTESLQRGMPPRNARKQDGYKAHNISF